jgi:medium-chain acyl-[acyl-carrier-protein] hydrolase
MYRRWPAGFPPDFELILAQLPGREARITEPPVASFPDAVGDLLSGLAPFLDGHYALFGHSMGGLLAFGLAGAAESAGFAPPEQIFVSACRPPHRYETQADLAFGSDERLIQELITQGGTSPAVLGKAELMSLILPVLRADYRIGLSVPVSSLTALGSPLTAMCGDQDEEVLTFLPEWRRWTTSESRTEIFAGGHFYLSGPSETEVIKMIVADLSRPPDRAL